MEYEYELKIKPISINEAYRGRRFKTKSKLSYEKSLMLMLDDSMKIYPKMILVAEWGFSSAGSDWDNPIKPFQDALQNKYGFNDNRVFTGVITKKKVKKGDEYIKFSVYDYDNCIVKIEIAP